MNTDERTNGRTDERTNGRTDERTMQALSVTWLQNNGHCWQATRFTVAHGSGRCSCLTTHFRSERCPVLHRSGPKRTRYWPGVKDSLLCWLAERWVCWSWWC